MKRIVFLIAVLLLFSCEKKNEYSKELNKIFKAHGDAVAFKNVKTLSFSTDGKDVTFDLISNKKVVTGANFSFGFDGKNYWKTDSSPIKNPQEYLQNLSEAFLIPFSLVDKKQTDFDEDSTVLAFNEIKIFYNPDTNLVDIVKFKNQLVEYKTWQDVIGFKFPKVVNVDSKDVEFNEVKLSQAVFDDRFYQKPN